MTTLTFSTLEALDLEGFVDLLKRFAKRNQKANGGQLAHYLDAVASSFGYSNWSMLHKHARRMNDREFSSIFNKALEHADIGPFMEACTTKAVNEADAVREMQDWARENYSRLIDFAFYDNESETGFSWPAVDMADELAAEFSDRFPLDLIVKVGNDLDVDEGPWGLEDYGDD